LYRSPSLTVDAVITCGNDSIACRTSSAAQKIKANKHEVFMASKLKISTDFSTVLIKRKNDPYKDSWALPGGFVEYGETV